MERQRSESAGVTHRIVMEVRMNTRPVLSAGQGPSRAAGRWRSFRANFAVHKYYYLLMLPGLALLALFRYVPMAGALIAFRDYKLSTGLFGGQWVGMKWLNMLFSNPQFTQVLGNTIWISLLKLAFGFPAPIIIAIMLNEVKYGALKRTVQTVIYLPHFISWVVIGGLMMTILSPSVGILGAFGIAKNPLLEARNFRLLVVLTDIWKEAGWGTVVYLAAISGISPDLYEAATVDGAGRFQKIRHITLPAITGTVVVMLILRTGSMLMAGFDQLYVLQTPAVMDVGDVLDTFVYRYGLTQGRFSFAAAAGLFQSFIGLLLVSISNTVSRKLDQNGVW